MMFGVDATTVEGWYGGAIIAKEVLADVLEEKISDGTLAHDQAVTFARQIMHDTARGLYGQ